MNHTATINVWKQTNRVARLWEDLSENRVAPDPRSMDGAFPVVDRELELSIPPAPASDAEFHSPLETGPSLFPGPWEASETGERSFLEQVSQESIELIKQALEALTAPPDEVPMADPVREKELEGLLFTSFEVEEAKADPDLFPAMVRVAFEPEPHASAIETRRMAYGLKIPDRPLHKRSIYQRLFFCLSTWIRMAFGKRDIL